MVIKRNLEEIKQPAFSVVTIGTFDGVHLGHQKIIKRLVESARANDFKSTILTFFPHPRMVLQQDNNLKLINTIDEKISILEKLGLDQLIIHPFTIEFSRLSALEYVREVLVAKLNVKKVIIGYDHRFGRNRIATIKELREFADTFNFEVEEITAKEIDEVSISSTKIRKALEAGNIKKANTYLGYDFMLTGTITKGKGLGRQIEFPTANLHIEEQYKLVPKNGVYTVKSYIDNKPVYGMMNIGVNPTVGGTEKSIEVHFFNFDEDLYGKKIQLNLLKRQRDEKRFDSVEALKEQLFKDKKIALNYIASINAQ